jgi:hypothetical protein
MVPNRHSASIASRLRTAHHPYSGFDANSEGFDGYSGKQGKSAAHSRSVARVTGGSGHSSLISLCISSLSSQPVQLMTLPDLVVVALACNVVPRAPAGPML